MRTLGKLFAISLVFLGHVWLYRGFFVDDAFISFRVLRQWTHGHGLVYNVGEQVEAYSNFLWIVLLAPFDLIGVSPVLASKALGLTLGLLTLSVTYTFARQLALAEIAPILLAACGPFAAWCMGGLETLLFTFLSVTGGYLLVREEARGAGCWSAVVFGLLALARPEGLLFAGVAIAWRAGRLLRAGGRPGSQDMIRLAVLTLIVAAYYVWRLCTYGYWLPNTFYAKSGGFHLRPLLEGVYYTYQSFAAAGGFFALALPAALALRPTEQPPWISYLALNLAAYVVFIVVGGGDWMPMQRLTVHVLPFVVLLIQAGLVQLRGSLPERWARPLVLALVLGQSAYLLGTSAEQRFIAKVGDDPVIREEESNAAYLRENVRPGDTIAVIDAGIYAYILPLETRVVDMVGLADNHIAHLPSRFPSGLFGRGDAFGKWDVDYVLEQKPILVQVYLQGKDATGQWRTNFTGTTRLVNDPRFRRRYELARGVSGIFVLRGRSLSIEAPESGSTGSRGTARR